MRRPRIDVLGNMLDKMGAEKSESGSYMDFDMDKDHLHELPGFYPTTKGAQRFNAFCRYVLPFIVWMAIILAIVMMCSNPAHAGDISHGDDDGGGGINWMAWAIVLGLGWLTTQNEN